MITAALSRTWRESINRSNKLTLFRRFSVRRHDAFGHLDGNKYVKNRNRLIFGIEDTRKAPVFSDSENISQNTNSISKLTDSTNETPVAGKTDVEKSSKQAVNIETTNNSQNAKTKTSKNNQTVKNKTSDNSQNVKTNTTMNSNTVNTTSSKNNQTVNNKTSDNSQNVKTNTTKNPAKTTSSKNGPPVKTNTSENSQPVKTNTSTNAQKVKTSTSMNGKSVNTNTSENSQPVKTNTSKNDQKVKTSTSMKSEPVKTNSSKNGQTAKTQASDKSQKVKTNSSKKGQVVKTEEEISALLSDCDKLVEAMQIVKTFDISLKMENLSKIIATLTTGSNPVDTLALFRRIYEKSMRDGEPYVMNLDQLHRILECLSNNNSPNEVMSWYLTAMSLNLYNDKIPNIKTYEICIQSIPPSTLSLDYLFYYLSDLKRRKIPLSANIKSHLQQLFLYKPDSYWHYSIGILTESVSTFSGLVQVNEKPRNVVDIHLNSDLSNEIFSCFEVLAIAKRNKEMLDLWKNFVSKIETHVKSKLPVSKAEICACNVVIPSTLINYISSAQLCIDAEKAVDVVLKLLPPTKSSALENNKLKDLFHRTIEAIIVNKDIILYKTNELSLQSSSMETSLSPSTVGFALGVLYFQNKIIEANLIREALLNILPMNYRIQQKNNLISFIHGSILTLAHMALAVSRMKKHVANSPEKLFLNTVHRICRDVYTDPAGNIPHFSVIKTKSIKYLFNDDGDILAAKSSNKIWKYDPYFANLLTMSDIELVTSIFIAAKKVEPVVSMFLVVEQRKLSMSDNYFGRLLSSLQANEASELVLSIFDYYLTKMAKPVNSSSKSRVTINKAVIYPVILALRNVGDISFLKSLLFEILPSRGLEVSPDIAIHAMDVLTYARQYGSVVSLFEKVFAMEMAEGIYKRVIPGNIYGYLYTTLIMSAMNACSKARLGEKALNLFILDGHNRELRSEAFLSAKADRALGIGTTETRFVELLISAITSEAYISNIPRIIDHIETSSITVSSTLLHFALAAAASVRSEIVCSVLLEKMATNGFKITPDSVQAMCVKLRTLDVDDKICDSGKVLRFLMSERFSFSQGLHSSIQEYLASEASVEQSN